MIRYWLAVAWRWIKGDYYCVNAWKRCMLPRCPDATVGLSRWCREHTDQILEHRHEPALAAVLAAERSRVNGEVGDGNE